MRPPGFCKRSSSSIPPGCGSICNPTAFHLGHLRQNGEDQFTDTSTDWTKAMDIDRHSRVDQPPHRRLHVERVATQPIYRVNMNRVPSPNLLEQLAEARSLGGHCPATDALVRKLAVERSAHRVALGFDALISG
jgi:hypothetical protein